MTRGFTTQDFMIDSQDEYDTIDEVQDFREPFSSLDRVDVWHEPAEIRFFNNEVSATLNVDSRLLDAARSLTQLRVALGAQRDPEKIQNSLRRYILQFGGFGAMAITQTIFTSERTQELVDALVPLIQDLKDERTTLFRNSLIDSLNLAKKLATRGLGPASAPRSVEVAAAASIEFRNIGSELSKYARSESLTTRVFDRVIPLLQKFREDGVHALYKFATDSSFDIDVRITAILTAGCFGDKSLHKALDRVFSSLESSRDLEIREAAIEASYSLKQSYNWW